MKECTVCSACHDDGARFCPADGSRLVESLPGGRILDDRYQLDQVLGVGRQGAVYTASDQQTGARVVLKTLLPTLFSEPGRIDAFLRDTERLRAFRHPNAVPIVGFGRLGNGGSYLVTEYVDGRSLRQALDDEGPMEPGRAAELAGAIAEALGAAHGAGIVHGDVKPDNILLRKSGETETPLLVDFALAQWSHGPGGSSITTTGSLVMRVPHYSSPEQCRGEDPSPASDVYSLAVVLYEMLTGRVPFDAPSPMAVVVKHVTETAAPPSSHRVGVGDQLDRIVLVALAKEAASRPPAGELARRLRSCASSPVAHTPRVTSSFIGAPTPPPSDKPRKIPPPPEPLSMRMTIIDADDESNASRTISGLVRDLGENGMRVETGTVATGQLNVIRDHTTAFKNRLEIAVNLPDGEVSLVGFAAWYRPAPDGINWNVGIYIRDMSSADRTRYNAYLQRLIASTAAEA
jgi:serine/threonine protein kinase